MAMYPLLPPTLQARKPLIERFTEKIRQEAGGCWLWLGFVGQDGYGRFVIGRRHLLAHRVGYLLFRDGIPDGLTLDHLCRNRACVNPNHLEAVTPRENALRGASPLIRAHHEQTCRRGHPYAEHGYYRDGRRVSCRTCETERQRVRRGAND